MNKIRLLPLVAASLLSLGTAAQTSFPGAESIRYEAPEGTTHAHQVRSATSFYDPGEGVAYLDSVTYYTADYVVAEDGSVYLYNPFVFFPTDTWLKLDRAEGDTLVARLPQAMFEGDDGTVFYARRMVLSDRGDGELDCLPDEAETDVRFTLRGDTLALVDGGLDEQGMPRYILGLATATGGWSCYGEGLTTIVPLSYEPTQKPDGKPEQTIHFVHYNPFIEDDMDEEVPAVCDGDKIYWQLPYSSNRDETYWVVGEWRDNRITVLPQYLGVDTWSCLHLFAMPADYLPESSQLDPFDLKEMLVLNYNPATETYETEYKTQTLLVNVGPDRVYYADSYVTPRLQSLPSTSILSRPRLDAPAPSVCYSPDGRRLRQPTRHGIVLRRQADGTVVKQVAQ